MAGYRRRRLRVTVSCVELDRVTMDLLRPAADGLRRALQRMEDDDVPASLRPLADSSARRLPPPLLRRALVDLDGSEWLREEVMAAISTSSLILAPQDAARSAEAAGHAGVAQTVAGLLLMLPIHRRRGQVYLPADLLAATGLAPEALLAGDDRAGAARAIEALVGLGREHLTKAKRAGGIAPANRPAFVPVALVPHILDAAERAGADCLEHTLLPAQWRRQWWMWRAARRGPF